MDVGNVLCFILNLLKNQNPFNTSELLDMADTGIYMQLGERLRGGTERIIPLH